MPERNLDLCMAGNCIFPSLLTLGRHTAAGIPLLQGRCTNNKYTSRGRKYHRLWPNVNSEAMVYLAASSLTLGWNCTQCTLQSSHPPPCKLGSRWLDCKVHLVQFQLKLFKTRVEVQKFPRKLRNFCTSTQVLNNFSQSQWSSLCWRTYTKVSSQARKLLYFNSSLNHFSEVPSLCWCTYTSAYCVCWTTLLE